MNQKKIIYILLDVYLKKNQIQHDIIVKNGFYPIWLQCNISSIKEEDNQKIKLPSSFFKRILFILIEFYKNKNSIHHVEIYPGGRFAMFFLILAKLFFINILCVERGDLLYVFNKKYNWITRFSSTIVYKFSEIIWTRELYAENYLKELNIKTKQKFIHNVVAENNNKLSCYKEREIDFLWANSLKDFRKLEWFIAAMRTPELKNKKAVLLGVTIAEKNNSIYNEQLNLLNQIPDNIKVIEYSNPYSYYNISKYFILPTNLIFLNNALLEAMSFGVVPIISKAEGANLIIENNVDGFISDFSKEDYINYMINASKQSEQAYNIMSINSNRKTKNNFSPQFYEKELMLLYKELKE